MENHEDGKRRDATTERASHLIEAIEQVRLDMAKVELWAYAVSGFARSVPAYDPRELNVWLPSEQGKKLDNSANAQSAGTGRAKHRLDLTTGN